MKVLLEAALAVGLWFVCGGSTAWAGNLAYDQISPLEVDLLSGNPQLTGWVQGGQATFSVQQEVTVTQSRFFLTLYSSGTVFDELQYTQYSVRIFDLTEGKVLTDSLAQLTYRFLGMVGYDDEAAAEIQLQFLPTTLVPGHLYRIYFSGNLNAVFTWTGAFMLPDTATTYDGTYDGQKYRLMFSLFTDENTRAIQATAASLDSLPTSEEIADLPTVSDLDDALDAALAPLPTNAELNSALTPLATTAQLNAAISPLPTAMELTAALGDLETVVTSRASGKDLKDLGLAVEGLQSDLSAIQIDLEVIDRGVAVAASEQSVEDLIEDVARLTAQVDGLSQSLYDSLLETRLARQEAPLAADLIPEGIAHARAVVAQALDALRAAGFDVAKSQRALQDGDRALAAGAVKAAWKRFAYAYATAVE